jgi:hypothetical protein
MEPGRAAAFLFEAAEALASAHNAGLAHLCLTPHNLVWTSGGTVKVTGLGVEAVLAGSTSDTPASDDTQGLGQLLYAALTAHWCGTEGTQLPTAPAGPDGRPLPPGQLRHGVPPALDDITCRSLHIPFHGAQEPLSAPSAFVGALRQVPRSPLPFVPLAGSTPPSVINRPDAQLSEPGHDSTRTSPVDPLSRTVPDPPSMRNAHTQRAQRPSRSAPTRHAAEVGGTVSRPVLAAIAVGVLLIVAIGGWGLSRLGGGGGDSKQKAGAKTSSAAKPKVGVLKPQGAAGYDASPGSHPDAALPKDPGNAIDASKASFWGTQHYIDPHYGRYKKGLGLMIDMGHSVKVDHVEVTMPDASQQGTVELRVGDSDDVSMPKTDTGPASGVFRLSGGSAQGRYLLLWFTKLPMTDQYRVRVNDVVVYGTG